ncbi:transmembrane protein 35B-like isoform X1 [Mobula hypostoma]|uniref:transmembrane protein 35B-like isoform X1 n=1 Tax=Mobula hypostoma TaxID=723540 RepID=UPI002FC343C2
MALMFVSLRLVVGFLFVFTGMIKVTDRISPELYAEGLGEFVKFADVFPLKRFGISIEPLTFLTAVGWIELVGGLLLAVGPRILQEISDVVLSVIMIGAIYSLLMLKKPLYMCIPAAVCLGILLVLLYVWGRDREKQKKE